MKFCRDCRHFDVIDGETVSFRGVVIEFSVPTQTRCTASPELYDPVTGTPGFCTTTSPQDRRYSEMLCGREARWFKLRAS